MPDATTGTSTSPTGPNGVVGFDAFEIWRQYQVVAMHFNDLLMRLRAQSLAAVATVATVAGVVVKSDVNTGLRWGTLAAVFGALFLFWIAIWVLDSLYYNRLLLGAVDALIELEAQSATSSRVGQLILSTRIERAVAEQHPARSARRGRGSATWWFYLIVALVLALAFVGSLIAAWMF